MTATAEKEDQHRHHRPRRTHHRPGRRRRVPARGVPELFNALHAEIAYKELAKTLTLEVAQHLGDNLVLHLDAAHRRSGPRRRGDRYRRLDLGPVGDGVKGHVFNALATASTIRATAKTLTAGRSTASRRPSTSWNRAPRCWRPASRSSTCSPLRPRRQDRAVRRRRWARPC